MSRDDKSGHMSILRARLQDMLAFAKRKELGAFYERDVQELIEAFAPSSTAAAPMEELHVIHALMLQAWEKEKGGAFTPLAGALNRMGKLIAALSIAPSAIARATEMKITLTKQQANALDACAQMVLAGEWPWKDISQALVERAVSALRGEASPTLVEDDLSDTPRTDACPDVLRNTDEGPVTYVDVKFARQLERELKTVQRLLGDGMKRIRELESDCRSPTGDKGEQHG